MPYFNDIIKAIQRFENAVIEHHATRVAQERAMDHREREYHAAKTEVLNLVSRYGKGVNGDD
jgi:uncharacterized protein YqgV (UPF0045/DUF77 family)